MEMELTIVGINPILEEVGKEKYNEKIDVTFACRLDKSTAQAIIDLSKNYTLKVKTDD